MTYLKMAILTMLILGQCYGSDLFFEKSEEYECNQGNKIRQFCINEKDQTIIVITVKQRGRSDSPADYKSALKKPKLTNAPKGSFISGPVQRKAVVVNDHPWQFIEHKNSEFPDFTTKYYVSVRGDMAYLISFSLPTGKLKSLEPSIDKMVSSLKIVE